jgi:amino-acid N-acetyltransferase
MTTVERVKRDAPAYEQLVRELDEANLPTSDLQEGEAVYFRVSSAAGQAFGGLVLLGKEALVRSVVTTAESRNAGLGAQVVDALAAEARKANVSELWLLTTGADAFFARLGFERVDRSTAPPTVAASGQFRGVCPASAILMRRRIDGAPR